MGDLDKEFHDQAALAFRAAQDEPAVRRTYAEYKKHLDALFAEIKTASPEKKKEIGVKGAGRKAALEQYLQDALARVRAAPEAQRGLFDVTLPGARPERGSLHPLTLVTDELLHVFGKLGFRLASGPEVEVPFFNFEALNIPPDHPARDPSENFFLEERARGEGAGDDVPLLMRSQTSTIQIRTLVREKPPLRIVGPGKCFRPDEVDATHMFQFSQIEGLAVDEGLSFADLKTVLVLFAREMFGADQEVRLRPSFFPFTEPSAEFDFRCWICHGKGCPTCKRTGWIELGGCGMVDPNVFAAVGLDPERWTGFAFGFGIDRTAMLRFGIHDVRLFTDNDVRFLEQFG
jgi:phenylalanyl-tRNA synthetase alpha chain